MQNIFGFTAKNGVHFIATRTEKEGKTLIAFYDARFPQCQRDNIPAQFVSRYYAETLAEHNGGLNLEGSEPDWKIDGKSFALVKDALINGRA